MRAHASLCVCVCVCEHTHTHISLKVGWHQHPAKKNETGICIFVALQFNNEMAGGLTRRHVEVFFSNYRKKFGWSTCSLGGGIPWVGGI